MENKSSDRQGKISLDKIVREIAELESSRGEPDKIWSLSDIDELIASTNAVSPVPADEDDAELLTSIQYYEDAYSDDKASRYESVREPEPEPEYEHEETAEPEQGADEPDVDISDKTEDEAPAEPEEANEAPAEAEPADEMPAEEAESEEAVEAPAEEEDEAPVEDAVSEKRTAFPLKLRLPKKNPTALPLRPRTKPPPRTAKRYTQIQNSSCRSQRATAIRIQTKTAKPSGRRLFLSTARMRPRRTARKRKSRLSRSFSARRRQDISASPPRRRRTTPKMRSAPCPDFLTIPLCSVR